jgi:hypothetical protein
MSENTIMYKRYLLGDRLVIVTRIEDYNQVTVMDEVTSALSTIPLKAIDEMSEVGYGTPQKGDFVTDYMAVYLMISDDIMLHNGVEFPVNPQTRVIRRFRVGFNILIGKELCHIWSISLLGRYPLIKLREHLDEDELMITEYTNPFV